MKRVFEFGDGAPSDFLPASLFAFGPSGGGAFAGVSGASFGAPSVISSAEAFSLSSAPDSVVTVSVPGWQSGGVVSEAPLPVAAVNGITSFMAERATTVTKDLEAANTGTKASVTVGGVYSGQINTSGDVDWVKVSLQKGQTYTFSARDANGGAGTLGSIDLVGVVNTSGVFVAGSGAGVTDAAGERATYTATKTGTHWVAVSGSGGATGTYEVVAAVAETTAPRLTGFAPADELTNVAKTANLTLTFSEKVVAGTGNLTLTGTDGSRLVVDMSDRAQVSVSGNIVTVNPTQDLKEGMRYTVSLDADAVRDYAGNAYAGLSDTTKFNFTTTAPATPPPTATTSGREWNVMVYIAGDNNLESYGIKDINEMESVLGLPSDVKVTVLFDRAAGYATDSGNWTDTRVGVLTYDGTNLANTTLSSSATSWGEMNTGSGATLTKFINWSTANYGAENSALIVWNHGGGIYGSCFDGASSNDSLSTTELASAIAASTLGKVDLLAFDACLMQMAEVNTGLASVTDYVVASEDYDPATGFAYNKILQTFITDNSVTVQELAGAMVSTYAATYAGWSDITLSAVDTSKIGELNADLRAFVDRALTLDKNGADWTALRGSATQATEFAADGGYQFADLKDFIAGYVSTGADTILKALGGEIVSDITAAVVANGGGETDAFGLAVYLPHGSEAVSSGYATASSGFAQATRWDQMLAYL